jgi:hypothetical protein
MKLTENTLLSFNVVAVVLGLTIWLIRMSDKVEQHEKFCNEGPKIERRLYRLEEKIGVPHPEVDR